MESDRDEPDDIFEENDNEDRVENNIDEPAAESSSGVRISPPKRIVRNPRLKFNPERLCGERGIPVLKDHFKNVKFKGKGHEKEDLDKLMATLEHWAHRLFPSMKFEDCLQQIERLGKKRPVQTCLTKIRMDAPILNSDFVNDEDEDNVLRVADAVPDPDPELENIDPFDRLISGSQNGLKSTTETPSCKNTGENCISSNSDSNIGQALGSSFTSKITDEQMKIMNHNRMLAIERRKAKEASLKMNCEDFRVTSNQTDSYSNDSVLKSSATDDNANNNKGKSLLNDYNDNSVTIAQESENSEPNIQSEGENGDLLISSSSCSNMDSTVKITLGMEETEIANKVSGISKSNNCLEEIVPLSVSSLEKVNISSSQTLRQENISHNVPENMQDDYLGLESLLDLVDEE